MAIRLHPCDICGHAEVSHGSIEGEDGVRENLCNEPDCDCPGFPGWPEPTPEPEVIGG